jgi:hypothetical protein
MSKKKSNKSTESTQNLYVIDAISTFRIRYAVKASDKKIKQINNNFSNAVDELEEFSQKHICEVISSYKLITEKDYLVMFDEDNDYLRNLTSEEKLAFVKRMK